MNGTLFSSEGALLFVIFGVVALGLWLQRFKVFKTLGPALTVIVTGIVLSNLKVVPTSSATYDAVSNYCVPLSVSICLLSLDLRQMRKLTKEPVIALISAVCSVCLVRWCSAWCSPGRSTRAGRCPVCLWTLIREAAPT